MTDPLYLDIPPTDRVVLMHLHRIAVDGAATATQLEIATALHISESTALRSMAALKEAGYIEQTRASSQAGANANTYRFIEADPILEALRQEWELDRAYMLAAAASWRATFPDPQVAVQWIRHTYQPEIAKLFAVRGWKPSAIKQHRVEIRGVTTSLLNHLVAGRIEEREIPFAQNTAVRQNPSKANRGKRNAANRAKREAAAKSNNE